MKQDENILIGGRPKVVTDDNIDTMDISIAILNMGLHPHLFLIRNDFEVKYEKELFNIRGLFVLMDIARYYNGGDWKPDFNKQGVLAFTIRYNYILKVFEIVKEDHISYGIVHFKNYEDAKKVINNPNFRDTLNEAFFVNNDNNVKS